MSRTTPRRATPRGARAGAPPLIAVSTSEMRGAALDVPMDESDPPQREMALGLRYLEALERAGALPVVLAPVPAQSVGALLDRVDGVCLSGGPDINPAAYGHPPHVALGPTEPRLDAFEMHLARGADRRGIPIFGICRGAQLLNVARGGTLHQHLPDVVGTGVIHRQHEDATVPTHAVDVTAGSLLGELVGTTAQVNSHHHQAVDELGGGLVVTATAADGTVEGFEDPGAAFVVGVQWHAECLAHRTEQAALFAAFVAASAESRAGTLGSAVG